MNLLEESRKQYLEAKLRRECERKKIIEECESSGRHDTSKGTFTYIHSRISGVSNCNVGINVIGYCPNCRNYYERKPNNFERESQEYAEMQKELDTHESIDRMLRRRIMSFS